MLFGLPWWIYVIIFFIFISGYMAFRAIRAEKQLEHQFIEREGSVFMERMEHERVMRREEQIEEQIHKEDITQQILTDQMDISSEADQQDEARQQHMSV